MKIYRLDGTFVENKDDTNFGWYFSDIIYEENDNDATCDGNEDNKSSPKEDFMESIVIIEPQKPVSVRIVDPQIETEAISNVLDCKMEIEGVSVKASEPKLLKELKNINVTLPSREKLASLVSPCNTETKALLSVLYFAKYKTLLKHEASDDLFRALNFRTTNSNHLINDKENSIRQEMYKEVQNYHATKEDNMLSLMMELILTDLNCNLEDIVDVNEPPNQCNLPRCVVETSDLGNSIQSSYSSKDGNLDKSAYLQGGFDILSSLCLCDGDNKCLQSLSEGIISLQSFSKEAFKMHTELAGIKESFRSEEARVNGLIKIAVSLEKELKETLYLDDVLHLLKGNIEKVTFMKLPFRIFHKSKGEDTELNLII